MAARRASSSRCIRSGTRRQRLAAQSSRISETAQAWPPCAMAKALTRLFNGALLLLHGEVERDRDGRSRRGTREGIGHGKRTAVEPGHTQLLRAAGDGQFV